MVKENEFMPNLIIKVVKKVGSIVQTVVHLHKDRLMVSGDKSALVLFIFCHQKITIIYFK